MRLLLLLYEESERQIARVKMLDLQIGSLSVSAEPNTAYEDIRSELKRAITNG